MSKLNEQYIVDRNGKKSAVVISIEEFEELMRLFEKYKEMEAYDYDTEDVTEDIIEAFKDFKKGKIYPAREMLDEL